MGLDNKDWFPITIQCDKVSEVLPVSRRKNSNQMGIEIKLSAVSGEELLIELLQQFGEEWILNKIKDL